MNKSRYKLYKKGKKWVITAVTATSIGIGGYALTNPKVHADTVETFSAASQPLVSDSEFYKMADSLSIAAKDTSITAIDWEPSYESFKAALAAYEIIKDTHSTVYNDLNTISKYVAGVPSYITANQLEILNSRFNDMNSAVMNAYNYRDNTRALNVANDYVNILSSITNGYYGSTSNLVGSLVSKDVLVASSARYAISSVISSYDDYKKGRVNRYASAKPSSASAASGNGFNSKPNNDASYWQNMANSLNAEMNKKNDANRVSTMEPSSSNDFNTTTSAAASSASSATSSAATSNSAIDSSAVSSAATSYSSSVSSSADLAYTPSFANNSNSSSAKPKNDVYKNFYLSLKKKADKEVTSNQNRVAKYKKDYKNTKGKQQKAKKLKQYRDAKNKLNASQKHLKSLNAKSLKY